MRLIVAVRFPNTKVRTRAALCTYFQFSTVGNAPFFLAVEDSDGGGGRRCRRFRERSLYRALNTLKVTAGVGDALRFLLPPTTVRVILPREAELQIWSNTPILYK